MGIRTYTICRGLPEGAAEGQRHTVSQVSLGLDESGWFKLVEGNYYSDWGDRRQDSSTYEGTYEERDGAIHCVSQTVREVSFTSDHEMQTRSLSNEVKASGEVFVFKRIDAESVECCSAYDGFKGRAMSTAVRAVVDMY